MFMAAWRKEEVDAARHRQEKRGATRLDYRRRECRILRSHTHWPSRQAEGILVRKRDRPRPAVAPVDASRHFIYFLRPNSEGGVWGGGGMLPDFLFYSFVPVQQTTSGIGHRVK